MDKKDKGQTETIHWTEKIKDKHRQHNGHERQRTNTGNTMDRKEKAQTQAIQWGKKDKAQTQVIQYTKNTKEKYRGTNPNYLGPFRNRFPLKFVPETSIGQFFIIKPIRNCI